MEYSILRRNIQSDRPETSNSHMQLPVLWSYSSFLLFIYPVFKKRKMETKTLDVTKAEVTPILFIWHRINALNSSCLGCCIHEMQTRANFGEKLHVLGTLFKEWNKKFGTKCPPGF